MHGVLFLISTCISTLCKPDTDTSSALNTADMMITDIFLWMNVHLPRLKKVNSR